MMPSKSSDKAEERVLNMFPLLPNDLLLDAYQNALRMQLDQEFIVMLRMEIRRRRLSIPVRRVF